MTTTTITPEISAFAAAVREALADLPADERDDLTDGLEADLAEAYAEDLRRELPDPVEYATELRTAAGLPERSSSRRGFSDAWTSTRRDLTSLVQRNPALSAAAEFLVAIRPLWWVVRAWVAAWLVSTVFAGDSGFVPSSAFAVVVLVAAVVVSVQWGRGRWGFRGLAPALVIGNVVAAVLLIPVVAMADEASGFDQYASDYDAGFSDGQLSVTSGELGAGGLRSGGQSVQNVYAYDAAGNPLTGVQLFDQDGKPLEVRLDPQTDECFDADCRTGVHVDENDVRSEPQPTTLATGREVYNVFPLSILPLGWNEATMTNEPTGPAVVPPAPFDKVPGLGKVVPMQKVAPNND